MRKYENGDLVFIKANLAPRYQRDWRALRRLAIDQMVEDHQPLVMAIVIGTDDVGDKRRWHWWILTSDLDVVRVKEKQLLPVDVVNVNEPATW